MIREALGRVKTTLKLITKNDLDAMDLLRSDHMKMEAMLLQLRFIKDGKQRKQLLTQIRKDLARHMKVEEEVFYPTASKIKGAQGLVEHSFEEHTEVRGLLARLGKQSPTSQRFSSMVTQLIRMIEDHVMEEEDQLFPMVAGGIDELGLRRLNRAVFQVYHGKSQKRRRAKAA